jgi:murein DD-endopeptidase MepM/ murein hydrolase activator NlpD
MPRRRLPLTALGLITVLLSGCVGAVPELDFDFRGNQISGAGTETAPRPAPDANGLITYESYQVAVARTGDTVASVAGRIGLTPQELATFNGRSAADSLREGEILALPRRVSPGGSGTDIASLARGAIDAAEASGPRSGEAGPVVQSGTEPVRHRVARGETAYSVARLYGVSVRALAEWNGLGPDLAVREGQYLLIPIVLEDSGRGAGTGTGAVPPGTSIAPAPPSAATALPDPVETATLPPETGGGPTPPAPPPPPAPTPAADPEPTPEPAPAAEPAARFAWPVEGPILRAYSASNEGIDISAPSGTPVRAAGDGEVAAITQDTDRVPILVIRHADGLLTVYANIANIAVERGDSVSRGQQVAEVGAGEPSFLHFEVRRGFEAVDPDRFLP